MKHVYYAVSLQLLQSSIKKKQVCPTSILGVQFQHVDNDPLRRLWLNVNRLEMSELPYCRARKLDSDLQE